MGIDRKAGKPAMQFRDCTSAHPVTTPPARERPATFIESHAPVRDKEAKPTPPMQLTAAIRPQTAPDAGAAPWPRAPGEANARPLTARHASVPRPRPGFARAIRHSNRHAPAWACIMSVWSLSLAAGGRLGRLGELRRKDAVASVAWLRNRSGLEDRPLGGVRGDREGASGSRRDVARQGRSRPLQTLGLSHPW